MTSALLRGSASFLSFLHCFTFSHFSAAVLYFSPGKHVHQIQKPSIFGTVARYFSTLWYYTSTGLKYNIAAEKGVKVKQCKNVKNLTICTVFFDTVVLPLNSAEVQLCRRKIREKSRVPKNHQILALLDSIFLAFLYY